MLYAAICLWSESNPKRSVKDALSQTRDEHDVLIAPSGNRKQNN